MIKRKIELLAPAGDMESLYAAVNNGADAVYMGGSKFSARAYAVNFTIDNIREAVDYCHGYGVKIYITINTLMKQKEMSEVMDYISELYEAAVDGVIIQDLGLANVLLNTFEGLEIHASTQMTVHNKSTSLFLKNLGFSRIVLARELSVEEIKDISESVETEVFVHGALCVCYSGQCLMSSMIGGRSGNRGRCAQPCRLPYDILDKNSGEIKGGYLLSPKDMCTIEDINKVVDAGVTSFKIEGRMKRPEYVAGVVGSYRKAIDEHVQGKMVEDRKEERQKLLQLFNREGFSKGYFFGNQGKDMMSYNYPKNTGVLLGKALENRVIELYADVSVGDGIRVVNEGAVISKILRNNKEVQTALKGEKVSIYPDLYSKGDTLYKTNDYKLNEELKQSFSDKYTKKLNIDIEVEFIQGMPLKLKAIYKGKEYTSAGPLVDKAVNRPLVKESIEEKIRKTGNTPFEVDEVCFKNFGEGYISISALNEVRRNLLSKIMAAGGRENSEIKSYQGYKPNINKSNKKDKSAAEKVPENLFVVSSDEQLKALMDLGLETVAVDLYSRYIDRKKVFSYNIPKLFIKIPNIIRGEQESMIKYIEENLHNIQGIITANLGMVDYFKDKTLCIGDYKLNILNSEALYFINDYCDLASLSVELNRGEIRDIVKNMPKGYPMQVVAYGKTELMVSEYCAVGSVLGGRSRESKCSIHCQGSYTLRDRKGMEFAIRNDKYCRSHIYNSVPTDLTAYISDLRAIGISHFRYDFIDEDYDQTYSIVEAVINNSGLQISEYTRGHYKRGVE